MFVLNGIFPPQFSVTTYWSFECLQALCYNALLHPFLAGAGGRAARRGWCVSGVALLTTIHETVWISELLLLKPESFSLIAKMNLFYERDFCKALFLSFF